MTNYSFGGITYEVSIEFSQNNDVLLEKIINVYIERIESIENILTKESKAD